MPNKKYFFLFSFLTFIGCSSGEERVASATVELENSTISYFSLAPLPRNEANKNYREYVKRPKCVWRFDKLFDRKKKSVYDSLSLACGFYDKEIAEFQDKKLILNLEFNRPNDNSNFQITKAVVRWSRDGLLYRSTLSDGKLFDVCRDLGCGIKINKIEFPDVVKKTGDLVFDLFLDHNLSLNTTTNGALISKFHFVGNAKHQRPLR